MKSGRALWITNGIAEDDVTGEVFTVDVPDSGEYFTPIMKSSYHLIVDGMTSFYESRMMDDGCLTEITTELQKYFI